MMRKIGNFKIIVLQLILLLQAHLLDASQDDQVQLKIVSEQGMVLDSLEAGSSSYIEIVIPEQIQFKRIIALAGVEPAWICSQQVCTQCYVAGAVKRQERIIRYQIKFPHTGSYTIGPAQLETAHGTVSSNAARVVVHEALQKKGNKKPFVRWHTHTSTAYQGQAIGYEIRLYYQARIEPLGIGAVELPGCSVISASTAVQSTEKIDDENYHVISWSGVLYCNQVGPLALPAIPVEYRSFEHGGQDPWSFAQFFIGSFGAATRIFTDIKKIDIAALPAYQGNVCGVGKVLQVTQKVSKTELPVGESCIYGLEISGDIDMDALQAPELIVPDGCKVYASGKKITGEFPMRTATCEYVIQPLQPGRLTIPEQKIVYFNVDRAEYVVERTAVVALEVRAAQVAFSQPTHEATAGAAQDKMANAVDTSDPVHTACPSELAEHEGPDKRSRERPYRRIVGTINNFLSCIWSYQLPFYLFVLGMLAPVIYAMLVWLLGARYRAWRLHARRRKYIMQLLAHIEAQVASVADTCQRFRLIVEALFELPDSFNEDDLVDRLHLLGYSKELVARWRMLVHDSHALQFAAQAKNKEFEKQFINNLKEAVRLSLQKEKL